MSVQSPNGMQAEYSRFPEAPVDPAVGRDAGVRSASLGRWACLVAGLAASLVPLARRLAQVPISTVSHDTEIRTIDTGATLLPVGFLVLVACVVLGRAFGAHDAAAGPERTTATVWMGIAAALIVVALTVLGVAMQAPQVSINP